MTEPFNIKLAFASLPLLRRMQLGEAALPWAYNEFRRDCLDLADNDFERLENAAEATDIEALRLLRQAFIDTGIEVAGRPNLTAFGVAQCRVCGCTDQCACPGGCSWVEPDLCSACAVNPEEEMPA